MRRNLLVSTLLLLVILSGVSAQDYRITDYHMDVTCRLDNSYSVDQQLVFQFDEPRHGYYQEIPIRFGNKKVKLTNLRSSVPLTEDSVNSDWVTFRVGSADTMVTGRQEYRLQYDYTIGDDRNKEYDEVYLNLVGIGWQCGIDTFSFTFHLPASVDASKVWVTYGREGSTERLVPQVSSDGKTITGTCDGLGLGKGLTIRIELPNGYFSEVVPEADRSLLLSILALALGLGALVASYGIYNKHGRDKMVVPVVRFSPPEGLTPMEVGYLADGSVDPKDLTSMLFYWADKGYLTIADEGKGNYTFTKLKDIDEGDEAERSFFDGFFGCGLDGVVTSKHIDQNAFSRATEKTKEKVKKGFSGKRALLDQRAESKKIIVYLLGIIPLLLGALSATIASVGVTFVLMLLLGIAVMAVSNLLFSNLLTYGAMRKMGSKIMKWILLLFCNLVVFYIDYALCVGAIGILTGFETFACCLCCSLLPSVIACIGGATRKRSEYGTRMWEETLGFREFIDKVEMDKLKLMIDQDPEIFYHVLGYAIVLGLEEKWAKKFENLSMANPSWYIGPDPVFHYWMFSRMTRGMQGFVASNLYQQASKGTSGAVHSFSGFSGSSGGGFGGGGGGAW